MGISADGPMRSVSARFGTGATEEVIRKHFDTMLPVTRYLGARWGLADRRVLEIGSAWGQHLFLWGAGSEGVEIQTDPAALTEGQWDTRPTD